MDDRWALTVGTNVHDIQIVDRNQTQMVGAVQVSAAQKMVYKLNLNE